MTKHWKNLEDDQLLRRLEATVAANAGAYPVPLGQPMKAVFPATLATKKKKRPLRALTAGLRESIRK